MRSLLALLLLATQLALAQTPLVPAVPGNHYLLIPGEWAGDVGSFGFNRAEQSWAKLPAKGWVKIERGNEAITISSADTASGERPPFLAAMEANQTKDQTDVRHFYVNIPNAKFVLGKAAEVPLKRRALTPILAHEYTLELAGRPFKFTARNGYKGRDGAYYTVEIEGEKYEYLLPGFGWSSHIRVAADLDGDQWPDFIVLVDGNNSGTYYVLLSSLAKPGMNPPSAYLLQTGC